MEPDKQINNQFKVTLEEYDLDCKTSQRKIIRTMDDLERLVGVELLPSPWIIITQEMVNEFAKISMDDQWIHVDLDRARMSQYGVPVAHGFLILSLGPALMRMILDLVGVVEGINYGCDRVRFPAPTPVGSEVRLRLVVKSLERSDQSARVTFLYTFERRGIDRPVCVADSISLFSFGEISPTT